MYEIQVTRKFEKDIKYYKNKKHFTNVEDDIDPIIEEIEKGNFLGDEIPKLKLPNGEHSFKVRVVNSNSKNKSEKDGYRIIYYVIKDDKVVYLLTIYYKKDDTRIPTNSEIVNMIKKYCC